jgi:hypothetical protein
VPFRKADAARAPACSTSAQKRSIWGWSVLSRSRSIGEVRKEPFSAAVRQGGSCSITGSASLRKAQAPHARVELHMHGGGRAAPYRRRVMPPPSRRRDGQRPRRPQPSTRSRRQATTEDLHRLTERQEL